MSTLRDRLPPASTSTGSPPPRPRYAVSPRRGSHLGLPVRAPLSSRGSALSLASSVSDVHSEKGRPNGSSLKQSHANPELQPSADPLKVLNDVLGVTLQDGDGQEGKESFASLLKRPKQLDDPKSFSIARVVEVRSNDTARNSADKADAESHESEKQKFEELHESIAACDNVLKTVETYLTSFQGELGTVSAELEALQSRSTMLNTRLDNRKRVEKVLGPSIEDISISPLFIRTIAEGPVDESWTRVLNGLDRYMKLAESRSKSDNPVKALEDVKPLLVNLRFKAVERSREYLVAQIKALRSPLANIQVVQQSNFLPFQSLFSFLHSENKQLAAEICQAYVNTARWYYLSNFTKYQKALEKIKLHVIDKADLVGLDETAKRAARSSGPVDPLNIGRRADCLRGSQLTALSAYLAEEEKSAHYPEVAFRSFNVALVDNASSEYAFMSQFFGPLGHHQVARSFADIFEPTFQLGRTLTKSLIDDTVDCLGVLLCIRITQRLAFQLQRRKIPTVDSYINSTNILLWPRFQRIMDMHSESIRKTKSSSSSDAAKQSAVPHVITQRFAQFMHGILTLSSEGGDDEPTNSSLGRLRADYEALLNKQAGSMTDARRKNRYLYNNYSLVGTIIADVQGAFAEQQKEHFEETKRRYTD